MVMFTDTSTPQATKAVAANVPYVRGVDRGVGNDDFALAERCVR